MVELVEIIPEEGGWVGGVVVKWRCSRVQSSTWAWERKEQGVHLPFCRSRAGRRVDAGKKDVATRAPVRRKDPALAGWLSGNG